MKQFEEVIKKKLESLSKRIEGTVALMKKETATVSRKRVQESLGPLKVPEAEKRRNCVVFFSKNTN